MFFLNDKRKAGLLEKRYKGCVAVVGGKGTKTFLVRIYCQSRIRFAVPLILTGGQNDLWLVSGEGWMDK